MQNLCNATPILVNYFPQSGKYTAVNIITNKIVKL